MKIAPSEASVELAKLLPESSVVVGTNEVTRAMDEARFVVIVDDPKGRHVVAHILDMAKRLRIAYVIVADSAPLARALGIKRVSVLAVRKCDALEDISAWVHKWGYEM